MDGTSMYLVWSYNLHSLMLHDTLYAASLLASDEAGLGSKCIVLLSAKFPV